MRASTAGGIALLTGFCCMAIELVAVRVLAPHFGDSAYVWTNVIGVILAALALGALLGGRLADRGASPRGLGVLLLAAAALVTVVPFLAAPLGGWLLPQDLPLDAAMPALVRGSLAATLLVFAPAVLLLGCVSPWLVTIVARDARGVGRAAGLVSALATLGSLAGTFAATHWLVPVLGSRGALFVCAGILALAAGACLARAGAVGLVAVIALSLAPHGSVKAQRPGEEPLAEVESSCQFLQVVRTMDGAVPVTALRINEGLDSFHSLARADGPFTAGAYYDWHVVTPFWARAGLERATPVRVLSLGSAAGTFDRLFAAVHAESIVDEVEIDAAVSALGERWFGAKAARGARFAGLDARLFVNRTRESYDAVLVDTYARQIYVPAHVVSRPFFAGVERVLTHGGVVSVNLGGRSFADRALASVAATMADVFGSCSVFRVPRSRNFMLVARKGLPLDREALPATAEGPLADRIAGLKKPGAWRVFARDAGRVLEDGWPWLDALQDEALRERHATPGPLLMHGPRAQEAAQREALRLLADEDLEGALRVLDECTAESAYLRFLAGDVRWRLHDVAGARLEYAAAARLDAHVLPGTTLQDRLRGADGELAVIARAASVGERNAWLAGVAVIVLAGAVVTALRRVA